MPYTNRWVKPEKLLTHKKVNVWCLYKDDDCENNGPREYHFSLNVECSDGDGHGEGGTFDVRELKTWKEPAHPPFLCGKDDTPKNQKAWDKYHKDRVGENAVKQAIREAIESGELTVPEGVENK